MRICTIQSVLATSLSFATLAAAAEPSKIDFARQIRPILASKCFTCHGPDSTSREAGLRLDLSEKATAELDSGETAIVPGKPEASELVRRINSHDADERMPPQKTKKPLTATEQQLLTDWIASGAEYELHWAFVAPSRAELPEVKNKSWPLNEIDRFILARLEAEQLGPSAVADKRTLIRRLSFDLRGLPPSIAEVEQFLADDSPAAY